MNCKYLVPHINKFIRDGSEGWVGDCIKYVNHEIRVDVVVLTVELYFPQYDHLKDHHCKVDLVYTDRFPFDSPNIHFHNAILHPNIDERNGNFCGYSIGQGSRFSPAMGAVFHTLLNLYFCFANPDIRDDCLNLEAVELLKICPDLYYEMQTSGMELNENSKGKEKLVHT